MRIAIESGDFGWDYIVRLVGTKKTRLIQTDWDYPVIASVFGWVPCAECNNTDGTVDCTHRTASEMIQDAQEYLEGIVDTDTTVNDPGYFSEE